MFIALAILVTLSVSAFALWVGANLATTEKRLLYRPRRLYTSGDADFRRALGILLGPRLVACNRVTTLINGDRIFPPMLEAIREDGRAARTPGASMNSSRCSCGRSSEAVSQAPELSGLTTRPRGASGFANYRADSARRACTIPQQP